MHLSCRLNRYLTKSQLFLVFSDISLLLKVLKFLYTNRNFLTAYETEWMFEFMKTTDGFGL